MQHLRKGRKFGRKADPRRALMKSLATSFFALGKIKTTEAKAKELRPFVERFLTRAKNPTLATRRLLRKSFSARTVQTIVDKASGLGDRKGGYTRVVKLGVRKSDSAKMAIIEMVK